MAAKRTLLIEDEREVANTLTLALRSGVYEVEQALGTIAHEPARSRRRVRLAFLARMR
jgi:DNA-binding response OmpR family regulator